MAGKFSFSPSDFQEAAIKYRKELLYLPIIGCNDTLQYMTARPGIRYKERVGNITGDAQFAPYNPARSKDFDLHLSFREIETYFGSVVAKFEPNSAISTLLGTGATKGDGQMSTPTAKHSMIDEKNSIAGCPNIIVGIPGGILDHFNRGHISRSSSLTSLTNASKWASATR